MPIPEEEAIRNQILNNVTKIISLSPESLVRNEELGTTLSFQDSLPIFKRVNDFLTNVTEITLSHVPFNLLNSINGQIANLSSTYDAIKQYNIASYPQNAMVVRDQLSNQLYEHYQNAFSTTVPYITFHNLTNEDIRKSKERLKELDNAIDKKNTLEKNYIQELEQTLNSVRKSAQEVGVSQHSKHFKEEAEEHKSNSIKWLVASVIVGAICAGFSVGVLIYYETIISTQVYDTSKQLALAFPKIAIFTLLYYFLLMCIKNYRAHRHGYVVNKHRQNSLSSFETFAQSASDQETKNAVLMQATQSIFNAQNTGYITNENDNIQTPKIIEIVKNIAEKK